MQKRRWLEVTTALDLLIQKRRWLEQGRGESPGGQGVCAELTESRAQHETNRADWPQLEQPAGLILL